MDRIAATVHADLQETFDQPGLLYKMLRSHHLGIKGEDTRKNHFKVLELSSQPLVNRGELFLLKLLKLIWKSYRSWNYVLWKYVLR